MKIGTGRIGGMCLVAVALCSGGGGGVSSALAQPVLQWEHRYPGSSPPAGLADKAIGVYSDGTNVYAAGT
ncbi:MAG: hypothetical protein JNM80_00695, partial [Phycisphaerae bacterium]|nr:hypothetical protein [Phycisphaerae bacterium]